ncbi:outer membrane beta-barrel family protein [Pedobacter sp. KR3-3]|uniref:Outer membrane beta-barrel family protein n=1 Tax=Pedobacter albus TaxID=3113905 RepID=A0ABU7I8C8_9SPHI|nr:outer membrane beta-barrel family protein [Pedobacter sp. KR3-3]MEE1945698.1 outer membrane beta-barrel family protein [Pedobacter sp. KR3-3]
MKQLLLALWLFPSMLWAQQGILTGRITGKDNLPLQGASINLYATIGDKSLQHTLTDEKGKFKLQLPAVESYIVVSHVGYVAYRSKISADAELNIQLQEETQLLQTVAIQGNRPFVEQQFDRTVVNVDGNLKAGSNAIDILKKLPGVVLLNETELKLEGKSVEIMLDGRLTRLGGQELIQLLSTTSPANISKIELIPMPSAKYDAQGGGAIINIKTLKREKPGYDLVLGLTASHGWKYWNGNSALFGFNVRQKNDFFYGSYSYSFGKQSQQIDRNTYLNEIGTALRDKEVYRTPWFGHNLRLGWDHFLNKNDVIGILITANNGEYNPELTTETRIQRLNSNIVDSLRLNNADNNRLNKGINFNLNYKKLLDSTKRQELSMDLDLGLFKLNTDNHLDLLLQLPNGQALTPNQLFLQDGQTLSGIYSYKVDYSRQLYKGNLELGLKASYVNLDNEFNSLYRTGAGPFADLGSNDFRYRETLLAAYASTRQTWGKFTARVGLRAEQTFTNGHSLTLDSLVQRSYINLFPNVILAYKLGQQNLSLSYARRIGRPSYSYLNPFAIYRNAYSVSRGNPYLNPSFSDQFRLGLNLKNGLSFALSYSYVNNVIKDLQLVDNQTKITTNLKANLHTNNNAALYVTYASQFFKVWDFNVSMGSSLNSYQFAYQNQTVEVKQWAGTANMNSHFKLSNQWYADLDFYGSTRVTYGNQVNLPFYTVGAGIGKSLWKDKATLALSANDIFFSSIQKGVANYGNYQSDYSSRYDSRSFRLSFNYRFGNSKVEVRKRNSGSAEEQGRNQ